jgi:hypothetical protein
VPYDTPPTQRTPKPEATGSTSWFCADHGSDFVNEKYRPLRQVGAMLLVVSLAFISEPFASWSGRFEPSMR